MHQNVCRMNYFNVLCMNYQFEKFQFFDWKWPIIFISAQNASVRIRMHQNACRMNCANVLCRKISKKWFLLHLNRLKLHKSGDLMPKLVHLLLNAQNGSICIRMHQNVCRMNCANVLYMKLSKQWFLSHFKGLKLTKYICHFVVDNPV